MEYVVDGAPFVVQAEELAGVDTVEAYCDWLMGLDKGPLKGNSYTLHASAWDEAKIMNRGRFWMRSRNACCP